MRAMYSLMLKGFSEGQCEMICEEKPLLCLYTGSRSFSSSTQSRCKIRHETLPQDDPTRRRPDISKAKTLLGWEPTIDLRTGLELSLDYFRAQIESYALAKSG